MKPEIDSFKDVLSRAAIRVKYFAIDFWADLTYWYENQRAKNNKDEEPTPGV